MSPQPPRKMNLPWNQHDSYWISAIGREGLLSPEIIGILTKSGFQNARDGTHLLCLVDKKWTERWQTLYQTLQTAKQLEYIDIAVIGGTEEPYADQLAFARKPAIEMQKIAQSVWLGDALLEQRLMCYLQPIVGPGGKIFGYESFVRARAQDGSIIGGFEIIAASKTLGIEYAIDRYLHVEAIKTFVQSGMQGFLFINFMPGFIQRPEVYLEGLSEAAQASQVVAKHIVLDFTQSENPHDIQHLRRVTDYCRSRGYSIALDDILSTSAAARLVSEIRPDFMKLDMQLVQRMKRMGDQELVRQLVTIAHKSGASVIAEGVEDEETHQILKGFGTDLFQGYHFGAPEPAEMALKRAVG